MSVLVTGVAGFIGWHAARRLLACGIEVIGVDSLNDYYDVRLKHDRLSQLEGQRNFSFHHVDLADADSTARLFRMVRPQRVLHLAAQAGVRYSIENPAAYIESNLVAFLHVLEGCRHQQVEHLVYASSSSVYGANRKLPYSVRDNVDHPVSLYAATKKANELMAHSYSHLYRLPATGLRFFTVYGPWGRPDMALYLFTKAILADEPIDVFNRGQMRRDFTYIDDIVEGVLQVLECPAQPDPHWQPDRPTASASSAPHRVYNIGNHRPVELLYVIELLEKHLGRKAQLNLLPMAPGDVLETYADITELSHHFGFHPQTPIEEGIPRFVDWYLSYHDHHCPLTAPRG